MSLDKKRTTQRIDFLTSSARTTSGNSSEFDVEKFSEAIIMLEISAIGGTTPSFTFSVSGLFKN